jgi:2-polyprenyl-6-methoxyphenol hydroxylase-like FAD-dependent oxidoreductase
VRLIADRAGLTSGLSRALTRRAGDQDDDGVTVTTSAATERYDLVIGTDGLHSAPRRLVVGEEQQFVRHLGLYVALVSLDPGHS